MSFLLHELLSQPTSEGRFYAVLNLYVKTLGRDLSARGGRAGSGLEISFVSLCGTSCGFSPHMCMTRFLAHVPRWIDPCGQPDLPAVRQ